MSQPDPTTDPKSGASGAEGCAFVAIGLLILIPSGLCSVTSLTAVLSGHFEVAPLFFLFVVLAAFGGFLVYRFWR